MAYIMVDVESDGPVPSSYTMICLGAVPVRESLDRIYFLRTPMSALGCPLCAKGRHSACGRDWRCVASSAHGRYST